MNVFEFLGLPSDHRKENKVTQLVKHFDEVTDKNKKGKTFTCQVKKDGVCSLTVVYKEEVRIFSRTGKEFTNTDQIKKLIVSLDLCDGVYMGELWIPKEVASLEELSGMVNPNRVKPLPIESYGKLNFARMSWFDIVTIGEFRAGYSRLPFKVRYQHLLSIVVSRNEYDSLEVLASTVMNEELIENTFKFLVSGGEEGIIIRDMEADWEAGHKGYRVMKKVRGVDYDLLCVGYEEGTGKYAGKVANLLFNWKGGVTIKCMLGKGWTHHMAEEMFHACNCPDVLESPVGKLFQVYALDESSKGKLRLAKVGELRTDKEEPDV